MANPFDLDRYLEFIEKNRPNIWKLAYPRKYIVPGGFNSPKREAAASLVMAYVYWHMKRSRDPNARVEDITTYTVATASAVLINWRVPTYFVSKELVYAALATSPPENATPLEFKWPLPTALFMLPDNTLKTPDNHPIKFIGFSYVEPEQKFAYPEKWQMINQSGEISVWTQIFLKDRTFNYKYSWPLNKPLDWEPNLKPWEQGTSDLPVSPQEDVLLKKMCALAWTLMLLMTEVPDLHDEAKIAAIRKKKNSEKALGEDALWHPHWLGKDFFLPTEDDQSEAMGGHGKSPRPHMRRGHWRRTPPGKESTPRKLTWIKPVLVNKKLFEANQ